MSSREKRLGYAPLVAMLALFALGFALAARAQDKNEAKEKKPAKACEPEIRVSPLAAAANIYGHAEITAYVRMPLTDERCYCPEVEFTLVPADPSMTNSAVFREVHEADCDPWEQSPSIRRGKFIEATDRHWTFRPSHEGRFGVPSGDWRFVAKLRQGAWKRTVDKIVRVIGG